jgi:hypothetical protein
MTEPLQYLDSISWIISVVMIGIVIPLAIGISKI